MKNCHPTLRERIYSYDPDNDLWNDPPDKDLCFVRHGWNVVLILIGPSSTAAQGTRYASCIDSAHSAPGEPGPPGEDHVALGLMHTLRFEGRLRKGRPKPRT